MNNYNTKLVIRINIIKFWSFSGTSVKNKFPIHYKFVFSSYKKNNLFDFNIFMLNFKKVFPIISSIFLKKGNCLFIGTDLVYNTKYTNSVSNNAVGILTNYSLNGYKIFTAGLKKLPSTILFFNTKEKNSLLLESKILCIPTVGFVNSFSNITLIDYPLFINAFYFYNIYTISRLFLVTLCKYYKYENLCIQRGYL
jgi:ribosomal protein S2